MTIIPAGTEMILLDSGYLYSRDEQKQIEAYLSKEIGVKCVFAPEVFPESDLSQVKNGLDNIRNEIRDFRSQYASNCASDRSDHRTLNCDTLLKSIVCLFFGFSFGCVLALLI